MRPITNTWALHKEALEMHHCANGYLARCLDGTWRLFSVLTPAGKRMATISIERDGLIWTIDDVRSFANASVSPAMRARWRRISPAVMVSFDGIRL